MNVVGGAIGWVLGAARAVSVTVLRALVRLIVETAEAATSWVSLHEDADSEADRAAEEALTESARALCAVLHEECGPGHRPICEEQ